MRDIQRLMGCLLYYGKPLADSEYWWVVLQGVRTPCTREVPAAACWFVDIRRLLCACG